MDIHNVTVKNYKQLKKLFSEDNRIIKTESNTGIIVKKPGWLNLIIPKKIETRNIKHNNEITLIYLSLKFLKKDILTKLKTTPANNSQALEIDE